MYDLKNGIDIKRLQKKAKFTYINQYHGKEAKRFRTLFKRPAFAKLLERYATPPVVVTSIALLGERSLGVVATEDLKLAKGGKPKRLGIYWGHLSLNASHHSHYIFLLGKYEIDAHKYGNWTRFINHSEGNENVIANHKFCLIGNKRLPYIEYALVKKVKKGEQLLVNYGPFYEIDEEHQVFLNPSNTHLGIADVYAKNEKEYAPVKGKLLSLCRELIPTTKQFYGIKEFMRMLTSSTQTKINLRDKLELPFIQAAQNGKMLPDKQQQGITFLMLSAYMGKLALVRALVTHHKANVGQRNCQLGFTAVFYAVLSAGKPLVQLRMIQCLIQAGAEVVHKDKRGRTILHVCVEKKNLKLLKLILSDKKLKPDAMDALNIRDNKDLCPITYAMLCGESEIVDYLLEAFQRYYKQSLFHPRHNDWFVPTLKDVMKECPKNKWQALHKVLIKHGIAINKPALKVIGTIGSKLK